MRLKDKGVLVTGACGFIGSHLVERLLGEGCRVRAFVYYNSFNSWGWIDSYSKKTLNKIEVVTGDIRDTNGVRAAMTDIDIIFHLAALIGIPFSYNSPDSYVDTNIRGTLNVLQAARDVGADKVIITSTSEVYGTAKYVPIDEGHPLQGQSPYSASKIAADKMAESFYLSFGTPVVIARPFNTFGPRQSARAVIPTIISQILSEKKEIELGNLDPIRDMNYVSDVCEAFVAIAKSDRAIGEVFNIACGSELSISSIAKMIIDITRSNKKIVTSCERKRPRASEVDRLLGSSDKIRSLTGWEPKYNIEAGLKETIKWFGKKENLRLYKPGVYNV